MTVSINSINVGSPEKSFFTFIATQLAIITVLLFHFSSLPSFSFLAGEEEGDEIIYHINGRDHADEFGRTDSQASFQLDREATKGAFKTIKPKRVVSAGALNQVDLDRARRQSKGYY